MSLPWLVCYRVENGRLLKCFACEKEWEAKQSAAYLNHFGAGEFVHVRSEEYAQNKA